ncbi:baseplate assembly protein [Pectobacterium carotovorum]|uniref:baseplate assembly protein n=1 Tax=Pectobacterium carotovorum TaxID=554 RepID=UPI003015B6FC
MALTEPNFIERDAAKITAEMIAKYEADSGKTLYPAQAERLLINLFAYRETLLRSAVQEAAKQNLVAFARAPMLDYLAELVGVYRLAAQPARAELRFTPETPLVSDLLIPAGTRVSASDSVIFTTDSDALLRASGSGVTVLATCTESGDVGNDWLPAQISTLLDEIGDSDLSVVNITKSSGGSAEEDDDRLRERVQLAPESFSTAGSKLAYRFHAMRAHQNIVDVAVMSPEPGEVVLYPLLSTGLPDSSMLSLVESFCSDEQVRPLTDFVSAKSPMQVDYAISAKLTLFNGEQAGVVQAAAEKAVQAWVETRTATLGRDIVPSQIIATLSIPGVYQVELVSPSLMVLDDSEWANCTGINVSVVGVSNG